jgi:hypothetical protein
MKHKKRILLAILLVLLCGVCANAQQKTLQAIIDYATNAQQVYIITLYDDTQFVGNVIYKDSNYLSIRTRLLPKVDLPLKNIKNIEKVADANLENGKYIFPNPNATRYLFAPSGISLKKGEGYYQNTYLLLNSCNYGITDHISVGGGIELITTSQFITGKVRSPILFFTPKISGKIAKNIYVGAGVFYVVLPAFNNSADKPASLSLPYAMATYGNAEHNVTLSGGVGITSKNINNDNLRQYLPIVTLSGMTRISKRISLITENWLISPPNTLRQVPLISYGARFFGEKIAVDFAFVNNKDIAKSIFIGVPYLDFVVKF